MNDIQKALILYFAIFALAVYADIHVNKIKRKNNFFLRWWRTIISSFCLLYVIASGIYIKILTS
jgi:hypothetical protein